MNPISLDRLETYGIQTLDYGTVWHRLQQYCKSNVHWWETNAKEQIVRIANRIPREWRFAPSCTYRIDREVGFDQREGPEYEFDKFLDELDPIWNISGIAHFDLSRKSDLWKAFAYTNRIPIWALSRWQYSRLNPENIFREEFLRSLAGLSLSHIDPKDTGLLKIFQKKETWCHWDYMEWQWLWGDNPTHILPWIDLLQGQNVRNLSLKYMQLGLPSYRALGKLQNFWENLESLTLQQVYLGEEELGAILDGNPQVRQWKFLSLDDSPMSNGGKPALGPEQFVQLGKSGWLGGLERLHLKYHSLGSKGIRALGESCATKSLKHLRMEVGRVSDSELLLLAEFPWEKLHYISLSYNSGITQEGLAKFQETELFDKCSQINIEAGQGKSMRKDGLA